MPFIFLTRKIFFDQVFFFYLRKLNIRFFICLPLILLFSYLLIFFFGDDILLYFFKDYYIIKMPREYTLFDAPCTIPWREVHKAKILAKSLKNQWAWGDIWFSHPLWQWACLGITFTACYVFFSASGLFLIPPSEFTQTVLDSYISNVISRVRIQIGGELVIWHPPMVFPVDLFWATPSV